MDKLNYLNSQLLLLNCLNSLRHHHRLTFDHLQVHYPYHHYHHS